MASHDLSHELSDHGVLQRRWLRRKATVAVDVVPDDGGSRQDRRGGAKLEGGRELRRRVPKH